MNTIDIIFGIILILGAYQGFKKGLFVELASLIGVVAGIYGAIHFSYFVGDWLAEKTSWGEQSINLTAFALTFILIVVAISLAGKGLTKIADFAMLGVINKIAGAVFSILKFGFLLSVVLMFVNAAGRYISILGEEDKEESILYTFVQPFASALLPSILAKAKDEDIYNPEAPDEDDERE